MCKDTLKCLLNLTTTTPHTVVKTTVISHLDYCNKLSLFNLILLLPLCCPPRQQDYLQHSSSCNVALHNLTLLGKTLQVSDLTQTKGKSPYYGLEMPQDPTPPCNSVLSSPAALPCSLSCSHTDLFAILETHQASPISGHLH